MAKELDRVSTGRFRVRKDAAVADDRPHRARHRGGPHPSPSAVPDEELMRALYREQAGPLLAYVLRLVAGDRQRAEDVVQETLIRAWKNAGSLGRATGSVRPWLVAAAAALIIGGPVAAVMATGGGTSVEPTAWGTHTVLELKNVKGPRKCRLVAVSKTGEEEVVTSWSVPKWGYGIADSTHPTARYPLYVHGGAAMDRADIDHFEARTFDGARLVSVGV